MADSDYQVIVGDCVAALRALPAASVDLVFADPPYNLQLKGALRRPDQSNVVGVDHAWDRFDSFKDYDAFSRAWLGECKRVLKPDGALWVIGSYHNIFRLGSILQDLGFWILNDVVWHKTNPMPNFRGTRLQNATETLIWATPAAAAKNTSAQDAAGKYQFNYQALKAFNDDKQLGNVWQLPICSGAERLNDASGTTPHPTQKPEALLYRVLLTSSSAGNTVLDPFCGTGTTGAVARRLGRRFIGIEQDEGYAAAARARIAGVQPIDAALLAMPSKKTQAKVPFGALVAANLIPPGTMLTGKNVQAAVQADGSLVCNDDRGSIHQLGAKVQGLPACNGWDFWQLDGQPIDAVRQRYLKTMEAVADLPPEQEIAL